MRPNSLVLASVVLFAAATLQAASPTLWTFDNPATGLAAASGPGVMTYYDPGATNWGPTLSRFSSADDLGLPQVPDGSGGIVDSGVMCFPRTTPGQGYQVAHNTPPNGVHVGNGWVSNYTMVWDVYWPPASDGQWRSFYQTNTANTNDGDFFARDVPSGGVGISGRYHGSLPPGEWHRVAIVVRAADNEGQMHKYIDGNFIGGQGTSGSAISSRWALDPTYILFADESSDTQAGCVASFYFTDQNLAMDEVMALGGVNAAGANVPGLPPPPIGISAPRRVEIIAHRGKSCCAPENTLVALDQAFSAGAARAEIDIRRTSDGTAVLMHDATIDRTTDGAGAVSGMTVAQLQQFDAGSWFGPQYTGVRAPTLAQAMSLAEGRGGLYLDLKVTGLGPAIAAAKAQSGFSIEDLWLWPYNNNADTANLLANVPGAKIIYEPAGNWATTPNYFQNLKNIGVWGFDAGRGDGNIDPAFVQAAHAAGMYVAVYTILDPDAMRTAIAAGVDGMETDFPHILDSIMPQFGDMNLDGNVDRTDAAIFAQHYGKSSSATWSTGDFDRDGRATLADWALLQSRLGHTFPIAAVPEPGTFSLVLACAVFLPLVRTFGSRPRGMLYGRVALRSSRSDSCHAESSLPRIQSVRCADSRPGIVDRANAARPRH